MLWFTKTDDYVFNLDPVRIPAKYPGKKYYKGAKAGQISGNKLGKNPEDVWEANISKLIDDWDAMYWDIHNVKANQHENDFPSRYRS